MSIMFTTHDPESGLDKKMMFTVMVICLKLFCNPVLTDIETISKLTEKVAACKVGKMHS